LIGGCADTFAALWLHSATNARVIDRAIVVPEGAEVLRDLPFQSRWVRGDAERGISIEGSSAHNWRFAREVRYFV
jgi:hypothetical protein